MLVLSAVTEADIIFVYILERRLQPSFRFGLYVFTVTIIVLTLGIGAVRGYRVLNRLRSTPEVGNKIVGTLWNIIIGMAGAGCLAIIVSVTFLIGLLSRK
jgi:hypothetical protein